MNLYTQIPDPIERGEMRVEAWEFENVKGDKFRCGCGKGALLDEGDTVSADPYAIPVCPSCFEKWWISQGGDVDATL